MRGPGVGNLDLAVFRKFGLTERLNLEFRAEAFNLTNTPHFNNPGASAAVWEWHPGTVKFHSLT